MNNKFIRVLLGVMATAFFATSVSANLLVNPGFEDAPFAAAEDPGAGAGWTAFGANFRVQCPGLSSGDSCLDPIGSSTGAHGGSVVLKNFGESGVFQEFAATEGELWDGGAWVINPANADIMVAGQIAGVNIEWWGENGFIDFVLGGAVGADLAVDQWTQLLVSGVAPAGTTIARLVLITGPFDPAAGGGGGAPRWDDAFFAPRPIPVPAAVWLMGSALLGLMGMRRKNA